jgi:hypothetical protein
MGVLRGHLETTVVAMVTSTVMAAVPAAALTANADKVVGFDANQLVRAGYKVNNTSVTNSVTNFNPGSYQTVLSKTAKAPREGILLLWGNADAEWDSGNPPGNTTLQARLRVDGTAVATRSRSRWPFQ